MTRYPIPPNTVVIADKAFHLTLERTLKLDLYMPEKLDGRAPLVVWIHGGGWQGGTKNVMPLGRLIPMGYAVASIEYRLSREAVFPAQLEDCKAALRWLKRHADEYGYRADRIGVWGASAGGHLAALLGVTGGCNDDAHEAMCEVQAVVDFFGPTDLLRMDDEESDIVHNAPDSPESKLIGAPIQERKDLADKANPIHYIQPGNTLPPFLIVHGDQDRLVPLGQSRLLYEALHKNGATVELVVMEGQGHVFFEDEELNRRIDAFLQCHLS